jgi:hypothetical protein
MPVPHLNPIGNGVDMIRAAGALKCLDEWPFPWVYPPANAEDFFLEGTQANLVFGVETTVLLYNVPIGTELVVCAIMNQFTDAAYIDGRGLVTWKIDVNQPAGAAFPIGRPSKYFGVITTQKGDFKQPLHKWPNCMRFKPNDDVRYKVTVNGGVGVGPNTTTTCELWGWTYRPF